MEEGCRNVRKATWRFSYCEDGNNKAGKGALVMAYWIHVNPWNME